MEISIKELKQDVLLSKIAGTGTYLLSFTTALASVYETFSGMIGNAGAYAFCAAVAYVASAVIGTRIDDTNNALEDARKGSLEERVE